MFVWNLLNAGSHTIGINGFNVAYTPIKPATSSPSPSPPDVPAVTGINPVETSYSIYGHNIPLLALGRGRVGGEIISGPTFDNGSATGINSFGLQFDPARTLTLVEIAFDSEVVWEGTCVGDPNAAVIPDASGFKTEAFTVRFYTGSLTQPADTIETVNYGAQAVAYRGQVLLAFESLPLANTKFGKYPYVSAKFVDEDGEAVNYGELFERIAYSTYVGFTSADFETVDITDGVADGGIIITEDIDFLSLIQRFGRFYPTWDILQTDKLRISDRGADMTPDITLDATRLMDKVVLQRAGQDTIRRDLELTTIASDADYTLQPFRVRRPLDPATVTSSVGLDSEYLPAIMDSSTRAAVASLAKYHEEHGRKGIRGTAMAYGLEIEPGDRVKIRDLSDEFNSETFKVIETAHGANNVVEFTAQAILKCDFEDDPYYASVVLLMGFEGDDGSTGAPGMTDESPHARGDATVVNAAEIDTAQSKFGSASLKVGPFTDLVEFTDSADWHLSAANSDQFTVECWVRFNVLKSNAPFVCQLFNSGNYSWTFQTAASSDEFTFKSSVDGTAWDVDVGSTGAGFITGVWYHLAADKDSSGKIRVYKNGVMLGSSIPTDSTIYNSLEDLAIGADKWTGVGVNGWIDEVRITKGAARYASDAGFAVPSAAFPRS